MVLKYRKSIFQKPELKKAHDFTCCVSRNLTCTVVNMFLRDYIYLDTYMFVLVLFIVCMEAKSVYVYLYLCICCDCFIVFAIVREED